MKRKVTGTSKIPSYWRNFVRDDNNETELFHFFVNKICEVQTSSTINVTKGEDVISNSRELLGDISPCSHEEADTRIFVHASNAKVDGS